MIRRQIIVVILGLTTILTAIAAGQDGASDDVMLTNSGGLLITAGHTDSQIRDDGTFLKRYSQGVHAVTEDRDAELAADVALYDSRLSEGRFYGSAAFRDSTRHLNADTLIYYEVHAEVEAIGNVLVTERDRMFYADHVTYLQNSNLVFADGNVIVRDDSLKSSITGDHAVFNDSTGTGLVAGTPVLLREDETGSLITVTCTDTLEVLREEKRVTLWAGVVITQDSLVAKGEYAQYTGTDEIFTLTGEPEATQISHDVQGSDDTALRSISVVTGDTIRVFLTDRKISGVEVIGEAKNVTAWHDSVGSLHSKSILESISMRLAMAQDQITEITAEGMAKSYYFQDTPDEKAMFVNDATGDTLRFYFEEGHIERLRISGRGGAGAKGKYYEYAPIEPEKKDAVGTEVSKK